MLSANVLLLGAAVAAPPPAHALVRQRAAGALEVSGARSDTLAPADTARWTLALTAGEYVELEVRQRGIDVAVRVIGPDGNARPDVDGAADGTEYVRWIAEVAGAWTAIVVAATAGPVGEYEIEWVTRREATPADRTRAESDSLISVARSITAGGDAAYREGNRDGAERAIQQWLLASVLYDRAGDDSAEAIQLNNIGLLHRRLGRPDSALTYYARALPLRRAAGDRSGEATTLHNIGMVHDGLGRRDSALAYYALALPIRRAAGDRPGEVMTLNGIGLVQHSLGRPDSALAFFAQALAVVQEIGDRSGEATTLNSIGIVYRGSGRPDSALASFARALQILRGIGDRAGEGTLLGNIGSVHRAMAHPDSALAYFAQALLIHRALGDRVGEAATLNNLALVYYGVGRPDSALAYFAQALAIRRAVGDRSGEATTLHNMGALHARLGRPDSALAYLAQALPIRRAVGDRAGEATTLNNIGAAQRDLGRPDSAIAYFAQALPILRAVGDRSVEATTLANIGTVHRDRGMPDSALTYFARALPIQRTVGDGLGEATLLGNIADLYHARFPRPELRSAVAYFDSATAALAAIAQRAGGDQNRLSFAEQDAHLFQRWSLAWLALAPDVGERAATVAALGAVERGRAQAVLDLMRRGAGDAGFPPPVAGADLVADADGLIRAVMPRNSAAVSYLVAGDTMLAWLLLPGGVVEVFRAAVPEDALAREVAALRSGLGADSAAVRSRFALRGSADLEDGIGVGIGRGSDTAEGAARRLADWLFPPALRAMLPDSGTLVVVPHGPLNLLPFAILPLGPADEPLGLRFAVRYAPSLAALAEVEARTAGLPHAARGNALVVGNPAMPTLQRRTGEAVVLGPLAGAEIEARWVAQLLGATMLTGETATEAEVAARLPDASVVHLASHGYAYGSEARARDTFIALGPDANEDGLLTVGEVLDDLPVLSAELVVLSACQTGLGDLKNAEGTVGLQRAFLAKGARSVLVSLWSVSDEATEQLMRRFYTHWLSGASKAEALRRAQAEVRGEPGSRFHHPRYWAAFQLVGAR